MIKRSENFNRDSSKALRKGLKSTKGKGNKRAKRNEKHIQILSEQLGTLAQQVAALTALHKEREQKV
ncbi:hypothetical protein [Streptomyces sp. NPDC002564]|uniref:hypothetical protein n=1 Tax=Streptomyces sp. NPDC002564 TaxID=3364649 RepID=UPI0036970A89